MLKGEKTKVKIREFFDGHPKVSAFIFGGMTVFALPPYYFLPLLTVGFSGLAWLLFRAPAAKKAFALGYWFGFAHFAFGFSWVCNALMVDPARLGWLIPVVLAASGGFFGLFVALPAAFARLFVRPAAVVFALAGAWTLSEWLRSFILTGFPWNLLGSVWAFSDRAIQAASIFGTCGLSLLTVLFAALPAVLIFPCPRREKTIAAVVICTVPVFLFGYGAARLARYPDDDFSETKLRIVQPSIPQRIKWQRESLQQNLQTYIEMSQTGKEENAPQMVVWGETANPFAVGLHPELLDILLKAVPTDGYLVTGTLDYAFDGEKMRPVNAMQAFDRYGIYTAYGKSHLVPFGEYIPLRRLLPESLKPVTNVIADFMPGNGPETFRLPQIPPFGVAICYEIIFPAAVTDRNDRPEWLLNLTNDGWYGDSAGPRQHLVATRLRAVEEGLTVVRAANSGISALISKTGVVLSALPLNERGVLDFYLPQKLSVPTPFSRLHNLTVIILASVSIAAAALLSSKKKKTPDFS